MECEFTAIIPYMDRCRMDGIVHLQLDIYLQHETLGSVDVSYGNYSGSCMLDGVS